jgi:hypothetical protein
MLDLRDTEYLTVSGQNRRPDTLRTDIQRHNIVTHEPIS